MTEFPAILKNSICGEGENKLCTVIYSARLDRNARLADTKAMRYDEALKITEGREFDSSDKTHWK